MSQVPDNHVVVDGAEIHTPRLRLRPWSVDDAEVGLAIYGSGDVARWLAPAMEPVRDAAAMADVLQRWASESATAEQPRGRWAIELRETGEVVGGVALLPLPPDNTDLELAWQLAPAAWGKGYATEAGHAVAHKAFELGVEELFAVVRPRNERGIATAQRVGMEWAGETDKYYGLRLLVYRLWKADLDPPHA